MMLSASPVVFVLGVLVGIVLLAVGAFEFACGFARIRSTSFLPEWWEDK